MANVLMVPASGSIIFDSQAARSSIITPLSAAPRISYDNRGGLNVVSFTTAASSLDRFAVDGSAGRLFNVTDALTGTIFSVNDAAGLPIIQVDSTMSDVVTIGTYNTNTLVVSNTAVGMGTAVPNERLTVIGNLSSTGIVYALGGNSNNWNSAYTTLNSVSGSISGGGGGVSVNGESAYTTVNTNSAKWNSTYTSLNSLSGITVLDGGNTTTAALSVGTNSAHALIFETNGLSRINIDTAGSVGVNIAAPTSKLHIVDTTLAGSGSLAGGAINAVQTWNTTGSPVTIKAEVTNTASGANAKLMDLLVGGSSLFSVDKLGAVTLQGTSFKIGYGGGAINTNTAIGFSAFTANATGAFNTAVGVNSLVAATSSTGNIGFGGSTLRGITAGNNNTAVGLNAGYYIADGTTVLTVASESVFIGQRARALATNQTNQIVIGSEAIGIGSNTITLGNSSIVETKLGGNGGKVTTYGTYTSSTNYERLSLGYTSGATAYQIGTEKGSGGGTARPLQLQTDSTTRLTIAATGEIGIGTTSPTTGVGLHLTTSIKPELAATTSSASTTITLDSSHAGTILLCSAATAISILLPTAGTVSAGYNVLVIQTGDGQISFGANSNTLNSYDNLLKTAGKHASATIVCTATSTFNLAGNLVA